MAIEIFVMLSDIEQGKVGDPYHCPIAMACHRAGIVGARVYPDEIVWDTAYGEAEYAAPFVVREFVSEWDARKGPRIPFKFRLDEARLVIRGDS